MNYKIEHNRLTKFHIDEDKHINQYGEGIIIKNDFKNYFKIKGKVGVNYRLKIYDKFGNLRYNYYSIVKDQTIVTEKFDYIVYLEKNNQLIHKVEFNPKNKKLLLHIDSYALGDTIAWMAYINDYFKKYYPSQLVVTTFWAHLFKNPNPRIKIEEHYDKYVNNVYSAETVGYDKNDSNHRKRNIQEVICNSMGITYKEKRPLINIPKIDKINNEKYICISEFATSKNKMWLYYYGWQIIVNYLTSLGYKVVVISKEKTCLYNVIDKTGDYSILDRVKDLRNCEFFIGVSSGLSWLAWALKKDVILISGLTKPYNEFFTKYRIINENVCNGCWNENDLDHSLECPLFNNSPKKLECSYRITPEMVIETINKKILK